MGEPLVTSQSLDSIQILPPVSAETSSNRNDEIGLTSKSDTSLHSTNPSRENSPTLPKRGTKRPRTCDDSQQKSQRINLSQPSASADGISRESTPTPKTTTTTTTTTTTAVTPPNLVHSFQNRFAQFQFPQNHDRAFRQAVRSSSADVTHLQQTPSIASQPSANGLADDSSDSPRLITGMTREEEERAADALLQNIDLAEVEGPVQAEVNVDGHNDDQQCSDQTSQNVQLPSKPKTHLQAQLAATDASATDSTDPSLHPDNQQKMETVKPTSDTLDESDPFAAVKDLAAVAKAAMGLDDDGNPLPGNEESYRALAEVVQRLNAQHEEAQKAIQQAAAAAAAATAEESGGDFDDSGSPTSAYQKGGNSPVKRFQCPKCERAFARAYNLNTHLSTHDPDPNRSKPFACPYPSCKSEGGRSFSRKHDLQRHVASVHEFEPEPGVHGDPGHVSGDTGGLASLGLGTPGKRFRCEACGRAFVRRDACNRHQCERKKAMLMGGGHSSPSDIKPSPVEQRTVPLSTRLPLGTSINGSPHIAFGHGRTNVSLYSSTPLRTITSIPTVSTLPLTPCPVLTPLSRTASKPFTFASASASGSTPISSSPSLLLAFSDVASTVGQGVELSGSTQPNNSLRFKSRVTCTGQVAEDGDNSQVVERVDPIETVSANGRQNVAPQPESLSKEVQAVALQLVAQAQAQAQAQSKSKSIDTTPTTTCNDLQPTTTTHLTRIQRIDKSKPNHWKICLVKHQP